MAEPGLARGVSSSGLPTLLQHRGRCGLQVCAHVGDPTAINLHHIPHLLPTLTSEWRQLRMEGVSRAGVRVVASRIFVAMTTARCTLHPNAPAFPPLFSPPSYGVSARPDLKLCKEGPRTDCNLPRILLIGTALLSIYICEGSYRGEDRSSRTRSWHESDRAPTSRCYVEEPALLRPLLPHVRYRPHASAPAHRCRNS